MPHIILSHPHVTSMRYKSGECSSMCDIKNDFGFQRRYTSQKEGGHSSFDITIIVSCKCKGYDWEQPLLCSPSMYYHSNRTCPISIIKICEVHSQLRRVYKQFMSPIGVKNWQNRPIQLTTIIASYRFVYYCSSLILANTLFMHILL